MLTAGSHDRHWNSTFRKLRRAILAVMALQDRLGLNPKGKRDLRWRVAEPADVVDMPVPKRNRRLRAVE